MAERKPRRRRRRTTKPEEVEEVEEVVEVEDVEEEEEEAPPEKPKPRARRRKKVAPEEKPKPRARRPSREESSDDAEDASAAGVLDALFDSIPDGGRVTITRTGDDTYQVASADVVVAPTKKLKRVSDKVFFRPEFLEWVEDWRSMDYEEKVAYAEEAGAEWTRNDDPSIDAMRAAMAVRKVEGVVKYKEGFDTTSARKEAKAKLQMGQPVEGLS